ncbi:MAG: hypothetical protein COB22_08645 [Cycloclasticus sp.]|nr:MAG: hypothetical protein COB22_08645 [Cycloclasticus sp.]
MKRASAFLLLCVLAFFSSITYSKHTGRIDFPGAGVYQTVQIAMDKCNLDHVGWLGGCSGAGNNVEWFDGAGVVWAIYYVQLNCPTGQEFDASGQCVVSSEKTDEECQAKTDTYTNFDVIIGGPNAIPPSVVEYEGCYFTADVGDNFIPLNPYVRDCYLSLFQQGMVCVYSYSGYGSSSNPPPATSTPEIVIELQESPPVVSGDEVDGGNVDKDTTILPTVVVEDSPLVGDTTTTESKTDTTIVESEKTKSDNPDNFKFSESSSDVITATESKVTVTNADGSTTTTTTTTFTQNGSSFDVVTVDKKTGEIIESSKPAEPKSGSTTNVVTKDSLGSITSETTNNTGTGGSGISGKDQLEQEGNCSPGQECVVTINEEGIDVEQNARTIAEAEAKLASERSDASNEFSDDGESDYGISNVSNFSADYFINRYLIFPASVCSGSINTTIFGHAFVIEPCDKLQPLRDVLAWVFFIITFFTCIKILLSTKSV